MSSLLLFSGNYVTNLDELKASTLYNKVKQNNYDVNAVEYLHGLEIVKYDYFALYNQYKDVPNVLFIVDPPYLTTDLKTHETRLNPTSKYIDMMFTRIIEMQK